MKPSKSISKLKSLLRAYLPVVVPLVLLLVAGLVWWLIPRHQPGSVSKTERGTRELKVKVVDKDGSPVADTQLLLFFDDGTDTQQTDTDGEALFRGITGTTAKLIAEASSKQRIVQHIDLSKSSTQITLTFGSGALFEALIENDTGQTIEAAQLIMTHQERKLDPWKGQSDKEGRLRIDTLVPGTYSIDIQAENHERTVLQNVLVPSEEPLRIVVQRTASISGKVTDINKKPANGATVIIAGSGFWPPREVKTNVDGNYFLPGLPGGIYELRASMNDQVSLPKEGISVLPGSEQSVDMELIQGVSLVGQVIADDTNQPIASSEITISEESINFRPLAMVADKDGKFKATGLLDIPHRISIKAKGFVSIIAQQRSPGPSLHTFPMQRAAVISGRVVDSDNQPVAKAQIEIIGSSDTGSPITMSAAALNFQSALFESQLKGPLPIQPSNHLGVTHGVVPMIPIGPNTNIGHSKSQPIKQAVGYVSDANGHFQIQDIPPGKVRLMARHQKYAPGLSQPRSVQPGSHIEGITIQLHKGGNIDGRVVDNRGYPVPQVRIELQTEIETFPRMALSGMDGVFQFKRVYGQALLTAYPIGRPATMAKTFVESNKTHEVKIVIESGSHTLKGRVVDLRGFPIRGASIKVESAHKESHFILQLSSEYDGRFKVTGLPEPPYKLSVIHSDYAKRIFKNINSQDEVIIELDTGFRVVGSVIDQWHQEPLANVLITFTTDPSKQGKTTRTKTEGGFEFSNVIPGNYYVIAETQNYLSGRQMVQLESNQSRNSDVELEPIYLSPGGSISGEVIDNRGIAVVNAEVAMGNPPLWEDAVRADKLGRFLISGVPPDSITLNARHATAGEAELIRAVRVYPLQETSGILIRLPGRYEEDDEENHETEVTEETDETPTAETRSSDTKVRKGVAIQLKYANGSILIVRIVPGSRAARAGLRLNDAIVAIDGETVYSVAQVRSMLLGGVGTKVSLRIRRNGSSKTIRVAREKYQLPNE